MLKSITKTAAVGGLALATGLAGLSFSASDADARSRHHRHHGHHGGNYLAAAGLGIITGAIIANAARDRYYYNGAYDPYYSDGYYARRGYYAAPAPRVYYEPQGYYYDGPAYRYSSPTGQDENYYGGYDCNARWQAYDTGSSSTNVGVGGDNCR